MNDLFRLKEEFPLLTIEIFKEFINTHYTDFILDGDIDMVDYFKEWMYVNLI